MATVDSVLEHINEDRLTELLRDLVDISSPTGAEQEIAEYMLAHYERLGLRARGQEVEEGRLNAVGTLKGVSDGPSLLFNGHMDTSLTGVAEHDLSVVGEMHDGLRPQSWLENGYVRGLGAFNMKGALAAYLGMLEAIVSSDVPLAGDLVVAGVVGEIEKTSIRTLTRDYTGALYRGAGCGTRHLITHGIWTDYAIVGEPSALHINLAHPGYCWFEITTRGRFTRTTAIDRGRNAIKLMAQVIELLSEWGPQYTQRKTEEWRLKVDSHPYSVVKPNVNIGAIEGGWPFKPTWSTAICKLYIDVRSLPGDSPRAVQRELESVLAPLSDGADNRVEIDMYMSNPGGYLPRRESPLVESAAAAVELVRGSRPPAVPPEFGSYWCDMNILNRVGIESLTLGSGDEGVADWDGKGEYHSVEDLTDACRIYTTIALDVCGAAVDSRQSFDRVD